MMYDQKGKQQISTGSIPIGLHCFHWFNSTLKLINWEIASVGSRHWDKGEGEGEGGSHPDPETRGCRSPKNLFRPFGPQFRLTISAWGGGGAGPPGPLPGSATDLSPCQWIQGILRSGFRIQGTGFRTLCQRNLDSGFPDSLSSIPDSKALIWGEGDCRAGSVPRNALCWSLQ